MYVCIYVCTCVCGYIFWKKKVSTHGLKIRDTHTQRHTHTPGCEERGPESRCLCDELCGCQEEDTPDRGGAHLFLGCVCVGVSV